MKILVTGAAGFIGYHLIKTLIKRDFDVIGIDNINDYYDVNLKFSRLEQLGINRNSIKDDTVLVKSSILDKFSFVKMDITDLLKLELLFKNEKFTHVVNLAAQAGVRYSLENPHTYIQSNVVGFVNILECCRNNKVEHFLYASSSSVYGANTKIPFSEEDRVDEPVSLYAATKRSNELMAYTYSHLYDLPTTGLRFFTVYGPWGRPDMAPMLFAEAITKGEAIKIFNNGEMQRDFTFVDDIVEGIVRSLVLLPVKAPKADIFNIGNSKPVKLMDFIAIMEDCLDKVALKKYLPMQDGDVKITYADTFSIQKDKGYEPNTELKEGVNKFIDWFINYKSIPR
jgi:UDP-glucuronate 4-epimerase